MLLLLCFSNLWQKNTTNMFLYIFRLCSMWPDWAIYWPLGNFSKPLATINLPKFLTFLGNFCKGIKSFNFTSEIIFGQLLSTFGDFYWSHWLCLTHRKEHTDSTFEGGGSIVKRKKIEVFDFDFVAFKNRPTPGHFSFFYSNKTVYSTNKCQKRSLIQYLAVGLELTISEL